MLSIFPCYISWSIFYFLSLLYASSGNEINPAFQLRLTRLGLDYANQVASDLLNDEIRSIKMADVDRPIDGGGRLRLKKIRLIDFREPHYTYSLDPPSTFTWKLEKAGVVVFGDWWAKKRVVVLLEGKGNVTANASDINVALSAQFGRNHSNPGQPTVTAVKCVANIEKFQVDVKGGIIASVINVFKGQIADYLKPMIETELCTAARNFLMKDVNSKLATFPITTTSHLAFLLDYGLVADPAVADGYIDVSLKGRITPISNRSHYAPYNPASFTRMYDGDHMFYAWASDTIINDLLYFAHVFNMSRFLITPDLPFASFLNLRCNASSNCLGSALPEIAEMFPASVESAEMFVSTSKPPMVKINPNNSASLTVSAIVEVYAYIPNSNSSKITDRLKKTIATGPVEIKADLQVRVENMRIVGSVNITQFDVNIVESVLDDFTLMIVEATLPSKLKPVLEQGVNDKFAMGFPIPVTRGVSLKRPKIQLLPDTVQVESDVQYTG